MKNWNALTLALVRKMLIPLLAAAGGFAVGIYPAEFSAFCSGVM